MLFDTHAHLDSPRFEGEVEGVLERAYASGVSRILTCGSDLASSALCVRLARQYTGVYASAGIHPHEAGALAPNGRSLDGALVSEVLDRIRNWAAEGSIVALGEIGLDYHYDLAPRPVQRAVLELQLALAAELQLPVILHSRESEADIKGALQATPTGLKGVLHCFMGDAALGEYVLSRGLHLGVGGPITFRKMDNLVAAIASAPLDNLLLETDSPYLTPHPHRGARNEPAFVRHVAQRVAEIRGLTLDQVARYTTDNACRLFAVE